MKPLNCNGCTACCHGDSIFLHEDEGDNPDLYQTDEVEHPKYRYMLKHKSNGDCIYIENNQCGIYEKRPVICRSLDCRLLVKKLGYTRARKLVKKGFINTGVLQAGMRKLKGI